MNKFILLIFVLTFQSLSFAYNPASLRSGIRQGKARALNHFKKEYKKLNCAEFFVVSDLAFYDLRINLMANASLKESDLIGYKLGWTSQFVRLIGRKSTFCNKTNINKRTLPIHNCGEVYKKVIKNITKNGKEEQSAFEIAKIYKTFGLGMILDYISPEKDLLVQILMSADENFDCAGQLRDF